jgi:hypothetical protein
MKTFLYTFALAIAGAAPVLAQFASGSTGADGALNFTTPGIVIFDPVALGLDPSGDNTFNFTTINIGSGVTVKLTATHVRSRPVTWLATGNVTISGTLDLSGAAGTGINANVPWTTRGPSEPGPGGYPGGLAGVSSQGVTASPTVGFGPGAETTALAGGAGYATGGAGCYTAAKALTGTTYGSATLTPLLGGSGGGGSKVFNNTTSASGGAGGGAIRIISSTSISVTGSILARGGNSANGGNDLYSDSGAGSGGAIALVAPALSGSGAMDVSGGIQTDTNQNAPGYPCTGGMGRILISSNANTFSGTQTGIGYSGHLALPPSTAATAMVNVTSVNGVAVPANPGGSIAFPDVAFSSAGAVTVAIAASNVPVGTVVTLTLIPEIGNIVTATCAALAGTVASSTSTCSATFPAGSSLLYAMASW